MKSVSSSSSQQINVGTTWGKKSKNGAETKVMAFGTFSTSKEKGISELGDNEINENIESNATEEEDNNKSSTEPIEAIVRHKECNIFAAASHKLKNKDKISMSVQYSNDGSTSSTLKAKGKYKSEKYSAYAKADATVYMPEVGENTVVTNLKVGFDFEAEDDNREYTGLVNSQKQENNNESQTTQNKKWSTVKNPYIITETVAGTPSTGLGYEAYYKRKTDNSRLTVGYFGQGEIVYATDAEGKKKQDYNIAAGVSLKHVSKTNNGILESKVKIRNKYIFASGNMLTASGSAQYTNKKINANVQAEYVKYPGNSYLGLAGRVSYDISKKVRHDKQNLIDLQIYYNDNNFIDSRSGISFAQWLVKSIEY